MKKLFLFLLILPFISNSQKIEINNINSLYEYSHVKEYKAISKIEDLAKNMKKLNYSNIIIDANTLTGENYFSVIIMGTPLQVHYYVFFDFKDSKYKLTINKFIIEDKRWSPVPLENIKSGKSKWISKINENLPKVITALESSNDWN